jgi:hypothetical protein
MNIIITSFSTVAEPLGTSWGGFLWPPPGTLMQIPDEFFSPYFMRRVGAPLSLDQTATRISWAQFTGGIGMPLNDE